MSHKHDWKKDDLASKGRDEGALLVCACGAVVDFVKAHREWVDDGATGTVADKASELWRFQKVKDAIGGIG